MAKRKTGEDDELRYGKAHQAKDPAPAGNAVYDPEQQTLRKDMPPGEQKGEQKSEPQELRGNLPGPESPNKPHRDADRPHSS
jgi:hypothetical protein